MHPFWNFIVQFVPGWVAPNLLTLSGWLLVVSDFVLLSYYDYHYYASFNDKGIEHPPIPQWVWLYCAITHFTAYTLDGIDGKQARKTKSSTPLGELFDHGLDSWSIILLPMCLFSGFGIGAPWGSNAQAAYFSCISLLGSFYISHWEKYVTEVLYLPWFYDFCQCACCLAYLVTFFLGVKMWHFAVFGIPFIDIMRWLLVASVFCGLPTTFKNIYKHYGDASRKNKLGWMEAMAPGIPFFTMTVLYYIWCVYSPNDIANVHVRIFFLSIGIVFSNITCRLIISQMSSTKCDRFNFLFLPLLAAMGISFLYPPLEGTALWVYFIIAFLVHLHFGVSVVNELCDHFNIYCFSLKKPALKASGHSLNHTS